MNQTDDDVVIKRQESTPDGTFGKMYWRGAFLCHTLEDPWNDNKPRISCIPKGVYRCNLHGWEVNSPVKFKRVWEVQNVPNRSAILIHQGNTIEDTMGCILVGTSLGDIDGKPAILGSGAAMNMLRGKLPKYFTLRVE